MQLRQFAEQVLLSPSVAAKCQRPQEPLCDDSPEDVWRPETPARESSMRVVARRHGPAMPPPGRFHEPSARAIAHHIMANHELQALEVMAFVLTAFPQAPPEFRRGLADVMFDEQRHTRLHVQRAGELGVEFGDLPVNSYIWWKATEFTCPLDYLAGIPLTFEGRNLDHTLEFAALFESVGDDRGSQIMQAIHHDEIRHVEFGLTWLRRMKPADQSDWDAYCAHLKWPLRPQKSIGRSFQRTARKAAGFDDDFLDRLESLAIEAPGD